MSKGLGPTNIPSNHHTDIITSPLRFINFSHNPADLLYGTLRRTVTTNVGIKIPIQQEHFPYAPDEHDIHKLKNIKSENYKRASLTDPEDDGETLFIPSKYHVWYKLSNGVKADYYYPKEFEMYKGFLMNGNQTIYKPETIHKKVAFEPRNFDEAYNGKTYEKNEFSVDPLQAEITPSLPAYSEKSYKDEVNLTDERIDLLSIYFLIL